MGTAAAVAAAGRDPGQQFPDDRFGRPSAQIAERLLDGHPLRTFGGDPADPAQRVVRPITGGADDHRDRGGPAGRTAGDPLGDVQDGRDAGLVVGEVHDDDLGAQPEQVQPSRRLGRIRAEVDQAPAHLVDAGAHAACAAGRRQGVRHVVPGETADRDRDPADLGDPGLARALGLDQPAAADQVRPAAAGDVALDHRRAAVRQQREVGDTCPDSSRDRRHVRVVAVEHDPAVGLRDPADRGLHLRQLRQRVDALEVEVIRGHIGQHARLVRLVADAPQDHPAAGGLEDRHVEVAPGEDLVGATGARPVARFHHPLIDEHPIGGRRSDSPPGEQQDVGDQTGHGGLAVRARDRHDRHALGRRPGSTRARSHRHPRSAWPSARPGVPARRSGAPSARRTRHARRERGPPRSTSWTVPARSTG